MPSYITCSISNAYRILISHFNQFFFLGCFIELVCKIKYLLLSYYVYFIMELDKNSRISWFTNDSYPYGLSYGEWTVKWWQWILSTPKSSNPLIDQSGENAAINQPTEHVWFLAGRLGMEDKNFPSRNCNVPAGRSILFPVINCEANPIEYPELKTKESLIDHVVKDENTIVEKICTLNGMPIDVQRVKSDPEIFEVNLHSDNIFNVNGGNTKATGDGYWVFLESLPEGEYDLSFRGSCENGRLCSGANYRLIIQNNKSLGID